ncbi:hypothetical protein HA466_0264530 [Hirschfeldia incana]|nr:hypothetical protein HA466_0264530 [Hirschfeldia incana]
MSGCEDNDALLGDGIGSRGKKRSATARSSTDDLPPLSKKRQAHRALVWQHFIQKEEELSLCNSRYCGTEIGCDTKRSGTSAMINHIARCKLFKAFEESGSQPHLGTNSTGVVTAVKYDAGLFRRSVNEMIVLNELPFSFVEPEGFRRFCHNVLPMYTVHCRKTATGDIFGMFMKEKASLKQLFCSEKKRVSLTTDIWTAPTTSYSYMVDSVESGHLRSSIKTLMKQLYDEYVMKIGPPSQGDSGGNMSENGETVGCVFEMSDDKEEYEGRDSLYSEMVSEAANEEASSELDIVGFQY